MRLSFPLVVGLVVLAALPARADKLDKDAKQWLDSVRPIMLPEEEKLYKDLADKNDRGEFQKIFWARRDPNPLTSENEFQLQYEKARAEADTRFKTGSRPGSLTDCGRVFILLGEPTEVKKEGRTQTWTYKGKQFQGGQAVVSFDEGCSLPPGAADQFNAVSADKIASPNLTYDKGKDGHIKKLVDQLPKPTPAQALIKIPRQDFPVQVQNLMLWRNPAGSSYAAGLVKGELKDLGPARKVQVVTQLTDGEGRVTFLPERESNLEVQGDSFTTSYGTPLKSGDYTIAVGVLEPVSGKGSVGTVKVTVPEFSGAEGVEVSPLIVLRDIEEGKNVDAADPLAAFFLGNFRLVPRFDNVFGQDETVTTLAASFHPQVDPKTGKPSVTCSWSMVRDGKGPKSEDQTFDTLDSTTSVGPVPLTTFPPGKWTVRLKVRDNVAGKELVREQVFEVKSVTK
jgi:GWxTD domain-containing protein